MQMEIKEHSQCAHKYIPGKKYRGFYKKRQLQNFMLFGRIKAHGDMFAFLRGTGELEQQKQLLW